MPAGPLGESILQLLVDGALDGLPIQLVSAISPGLRKYVDNRVSFGPQTLGEHRLLQVPRPDHVFCRPVPPQDDQPLGPLGFAAFGCEPNLRNMRLVVLLKVRNGISLRRPVGTTMISGAEQHQVFGVTGKALGLLRGIVLESSWTFRAGRCDVRDITKFHSAAAAQINRQISTTLLAMPGSANPDH